MHSFKVLQIYYICIFEFFEYIANFIWQIIIKSLSFEANLLATTNNLEGKLNLFFK